jgi:uncharacterized protein (DUF1697 family)
MALTRRIALLRAVNVGGRKATSADLRAMMTDLGLAQAQTLLQSGNLVFAAEGDDTALEAALEAAFEARFGYATDILVRSAAEWAELVAANPMGRIATDNPSHLVVFVLRAEPGPAKLEALREGIAGRETVEAVGRALYVAYPDGIGESKLTGAVVERRLGVRGTGRNWNTVTKLAALASPP